MSGFWSTITKTGQNGHQDKEIDQQEKNNSYLGCPMQRRRKKLIVKHVYSHQPSISQPDWDTEQFSLRHLSWWHARFEVDREERVGCPLAPDLAVLISEGPIQNIDEEENTE